MRDPNDRPRYAAAMAVLGENCRLEVTEPQLQLFWTYLQDLTIEDFERAVRLQVQTNRYFPTVSELRERVTPHIDFAAAAVIAFEAVLKTSQHDSRRGPVFSLRRVAEIVGAVAAEAFAAAGGSGAFEHGQGERDLPFLRHRFVESYVAAAEAQRMGRPLVLVSAGQLPNASPIGHLVAETARRLEMPS
ncbi:MAG: hypothetical protein ACREOQ_01250 [Gemmatimonadales bacterium]